MKMPHGMKHSEMPYRHDSTITRKIKSDRGTFTCEEPFPLDMSHDTLPQETGRKLAGGTPYGVGPYPAGTKGGSGAGDMDYGGEMYKSDMSDGGYSGKRKGMR